MTASSDWVTPAVTTTGEEWSAARYNQLINDLREIGNDWRTFAPTVAFVGAGSNGNAGSSTITGGYVLAGRLCIVRAALTVDTSGAWSQGTNAWAFDLAALVDGVSHAQAVSCTYVDSNGVPHALAGVVNTSRQLVTSLVGGSFPATPANGHQLLASGVFLHDG